MPWCAAFSPPTKWPPSPLPSIGTGATGMAHRASWRHGNLFYRQGQDARLGKILRLVQWPAYVDPVLEAVRRDPRWLALLEPLLGPTSSRSSTSSTGSRRVRRRPSSRITRTCASAGRARPIATSPSPMSRPGSPSIRTVRENGAMRLLPGSHRLGERELAGTGAGARPERWQRARLEACGLDPARAHRSRARTGRRGVVESLSHPRLGSQPQRRPTAASISTAMSAPPIATAANGRSAPARRCRWARPVLVHYEDLPTRPEPHYVED